MLYPHTRENDYDFPNSIQNARISLTYTPIIVLKLVWKTIEKIQFTQKLMRFFFVSPLIVSRSSRNLVSLRKKNNLS